MERPDPDELLDKLQRDEAREQRGRLKIFFGACAGVGKTFAMLQAARKLREEGADVVVGVLETHGREETARLLEGLEVLPHKSVEYRARVLHEFDLDGMLARAPAVALVDELAHANVPGARHLKRWQDVQELLAAGIDVFTTLNVQHLERLNDVVGQITGIRVWETIPDRIFDLADEVKLVDLPPDELLERMREGKVYLPAQAERAVRNFFRKGNLIALRELALRRTADRVDAQMREYRADQSISQVWQARERLLVAIGPGPEGVALVRAAARLAASLRADWLAVHVETPALLRQSAARRESTFAALKLAQELGAETLTLDGAQAGATLLAYAQMRNVSKLVIGASGARRWWTASTPLHEQLVRHAGGVDVVLIGPSAGDRAAHTRVVRGDWRNWFGTAPELGLVGGPWRAYAWAVGICATVSLAAAELTRFLDLANIAMLYLLGVIVAAMRLGRGPGVLASFLSVVAFDFFFVPPKMSLSVSDTQYLLTFAVMLTVALVISHLTTSLRFQARLATWRERRTGAVYAMARELAAALTTPQIVEIGARHVREVFQARVALLLPDSQGSVRQPVENALPQTMPQHIDTDVAQWVYDRQQAAGEGTDTLPASQAYYLPLRAPMRTRGVLVVAPERTGDGAMGTPEQQRLLDTFAAQIALALERVHYVEIAQDALVTMESERLRSSLLSAISHDLRTPLTSIVGFASMLSRNDRTPGPLRTELVDAIHEEAQRMTGLVTNLLDMARLQEGGVQLNRQWQMLEEVVGTSLRACRRVLAAHEVSTRLPADLPLLRFDAVLLERLFTNLLENAAKYTPAGSHIEIAASVRGDEVEVSVSDDGPGLPPGMEGRIFEKFMRGEKESAKPGIGLGLAICRAIVQAHGGRIHATHGPDGHGARFFFTLPIETPPTPPGLSGLSEGAALEDEVGEASGRAGGSTACDSANANVDGGRGEGEATPRSPCVKTTQTHE
ncbi:sensor histidine kinase KdpD [Pandoraea nosoerga]|nr:sensor histidine kinase KdpD [Pandoraea nosoerga]MBN4667859.1 sensor histidine kinase KdpD [Pandoraea nosoerga]MBN4676535.1 sensor histidine kinase KdpD [Pandoraea nosoerga]MBN4682808.1 sensor histidine kinase KdpD [Pandoraea nosoerga]